MAKPTGKPHGGPPRGVIEDAQNKPKRSIARLSCAGNRSERTLCCTAVVTAISGQTCKGMLRVAEHDRSAERNQAIAREGRDLGATDGQISSADAGQPIAPQRIRSDDAAIEIWLAPLDLDADQIWQCALHLSQDELLRANRFHFERDRRRFIVARATLRVLLGGYLDMTPDAIKLAYTLNGKPFVADDPAGLQFNVSHAHERALYAVSRNCALGVDIEYLNSDLDYSGLAERFFTRREYAALQRIPASGRKRAFLACWTRKEAVIKATGDGLSMPLDRFEVTVEADIEPRIVAFAAGPQQIPDWKLYATDVGNDYVATVAAYRGK